MTMIIAFDQRVNPQADDIVAIFKGSRQIMWAYTSAAACTGYKHQECHTVGSEVVPKFSRTYAVDSAGAGVYLVLLWSASARQIVARGYELCTTVNTSSDYMNDTLLVSAGIIEEGDLKADYLHDEISLDLGKSDEGGLLTILSITSGCELDFCTCYVPPRLEAALRQTTVLIETTPNPRATVPLRCGDGRKADEESCDDGNALPEDGCGILCEIEAGWKCAHIFVPEIEYFPENNTYQTIGGSDSKCIVIPQCGNGERAGFERCDDGGDVNGDGCSSDCTIEPGWACDFGPIPGQGDVCVGEIWEVLDKSRCKKCPLYQTCVSYKGQQRCRCLPHFEHNGSVAEEDLDPLLCVDVDECARDLDTCALPVYCKNEPGSFKCICEPGFAGRALATDAIPCRDVDECASQDPFSVTGKLHQ